MFFLINHSSPVSSTVCWTGLLFSTSSPPSGMKMANISPNATGNHFADTSELVGDGKSNTAIIPKRCRGMGSLSFKATKNGEFYIHKGNRLIVRLKIFPPAFENSKGFRVRYFYARRRDSCCKNYFLSV